MLSFEQAGSILDEAVEALPEGIFDGLNGGVNLLPEERLDEDGNYIMGLYHHDAMGRYVEIFYGSFAAVYAGADDGTVSAELVKTLHHELTHHVENKAGDRTLERWDAAQKLAWELGEPLQAESLLFVDDDGALAGEAAALFRAAWQSRIFRESPTAPVVPCAGVALAAVTEAMAELYDAVLCMTLAQADALAERFPDYEAKIMCLGDEDVLPPLGRARRRLRREIALLAAELSGEEPET